MRRTLLVTCIALLIAGLSGSPAFAASTEPAATCEAKVAPGTAAPLFGSPPSGREFIGQLVLLDNPKLTIDAVTGDYYATGHSDSSRVYYRIVPRDGLFYTDYNDTVRPLLDPVWISRFSLEQQRKWVRCEPSLPAVDLGTTS